MSEDKHAEEVEELFFDGTDLFGEGRLDEAMAAFDRCLALDPGYKDAILGRARVFAAEERWDEAIAEGRRLVDADPDDVLAYTNLSMLYQRAGRIEEAEEAGARARMLDWKRQLAEGGGDG
jgi:tetratricopeptide (TPR) repeat protein